MPNENSFDPDICGSKRPTYPEKDRFENILNEIGYVEIIDLKLDNITNIQTIKIDLDKYRNNLRELQTIYRALKQENLQLIEQYKDQLKINNLHIDKIVNLEKENSDLKDLKEDRINILKDAMSSKSSPYVPLENREKEAKK